MRDAWLGGTGVKVSRLALGTMSFGGDAFMSALHKEPANGLAGLQNVLDQFAPGADTARA